MANAEHGADRKLVTSTSRRSYLGAIAGAAALPLFSSAAAADHDETVITVCGRGTTAYYEFSVSGDVEKSTAYDGTINDYDSVDGSRVTGRTTREPDSYAFTGEVTDFETSAPVDVTIDGEPATFGSETDAEGESDDGEDSEIDESDYSNVVNVVEAGADNDGDSSITSTLRQVAE
ncbi:hypothetical protein QRT08_15055, partial [Halalkalicoccus sp. NIPERK01]|nr:hypothetical protein [Halalkalicoccus sp. NIPERK01]